MHRRLSTLVKSVRDESVDTESNDSTVIAEEPLPVPSLKVKRLDYYYSRWSKTWKYRNMSSRVTVETIPILQSSGNNDAWKDCSFVLVRTIPREENREPTFKLVVKSEYILKVCKDVIHSCLEFPGLLVLLRYFEFASHSAAADHRFSYLFVKLDPEMFITFFKEFVKYRDSLSDKKPRTEAESHILSSVNLLISSLSVDYRSTLATLDNLLAHGEITFDLLYAILIPRTLFVTRCAVTGQPRVFKLISFQRTAYDGKIVYLLNCESIDLVDSVMGNEISVGRVQATIFLKYFRGTVKIQSLDAYPIQFHPEEAQLRESLLRRGKKWVSLIGMHHKQFSGIAALKMGDKLMKHNVKGRIMVDRATFKRLNPAYQFPLPVPSIIHMKQQPNTQQRHIRDPTPGIELLPVLPQPVSPPNQYANVVLVESQKRSVAANDVQLSDEKLLLTSTVVYGFSLSDKMWFEFDVEQVQDVQWDVDAFANLVLPADRKNLLRSLVEAHHRELGFDDFIKGKGQGLVINLSGLLVSTFSAEATSEHVRRPLYVVGGGDLGTTANELDHALEQIFDVATTWKAIVLIDEADVFLEQRSLHDLKRNAMVAVFLRHVEYYRGILFMTTNRVKAFDEAFLSRIHVALHFHELSQTSKEQVWAAFLAKIGATDDVTSEEVGALASRNINGRQIKNAVRTAHSLAVSREERLGYRHLLETLDAMAEFTHEFEVMRGK